MRQLKIMKLKKVRREPKDKEYAKAYFEAKDIYNRKCSENSSLRQFMRRYSSRSRINLFSYAGINRCYKELIEFADVIEQKMAAMQLISTDICEKVVETGIYMLEDALCSGECMDCVKLDNGEWCVKTVPDERKISFRKLTDRNSLLRIADALASTLEELIERDIEANEQWFSKYSFPEYIEIPIE
jgi:hypothetical protein